MDSTHSDDASELQQLTSGQSFYDSREIRTMALLLFGTVILLMELLYGTVAVVLMFVGAAAAVFFMLSDQQASERKTKLLFLD